MLKVCIIFQDEDGVSDENENQRSSKWFDLEDDGVGCSGFRRPPNAGSKKSSWGYETAAWNYSLYNNTQG